MAVTHLEKYEYSASGWIGVYGASYGGAIAVCSAARDNRIKAVCLRAPVYDTLHFAKMNIFRNVPEYVLTELTHSFHGIADLETRNRIFDNLERDSEIYNPWHDILKVSPRPLFITTGDEDESIDIEGIKNLFERAGEPKVLEIIKGADHRLSTNDMKVQSANLVTSWFKGICPILQ